jgi:hypothetical protein
MILIDVPTIDSPLSNQTHPSDKGHKVSWSNGVLECWMQPKTTESFLSLILSQYSHLPRSGYPNFFLPKYDSPNTPILHLLLITF